MVVSKPMRALTEYAQDFSSLSSFCKKSNINIALKVLTKRNSYFAMKLVSNLLDSNKRKSLQKNHLSVQTTALIGENAS